MHGKRWGVRPCDVDRLVPSRVHIGGIIRDGDDILPWGGRVRWPVWNVAVVGGLCDGERELWCGYFGDRQLSVRWYHHCWVVVQMNVSPMKWMRYCQSNAYHLHQRLERMALSQIM